MTAQTLGSIRCRDCGDDCTSAYSATWREGVEVPGSHKCLKCERKDKLAAYQKNQVITTSLMIDAALETYDWNQGNPGPTPHRVYLQVDCATQALMEKVKEFDRKVWLPESGDGLAKAVQDSPASGTSAASPGGLTALGVAGVSTWTCAGRTLVQIDATDNARVTLITVDPSGFGGGLHSMGIQGIYATFEAASALLTNAIAAFRAGALNLIPDSTRGPGVPG